MSALVFDFGTTNFKAGLVDDEGTLIALTRVPTPIVARDDRRELSPADFWHAVATLCRTLSQQTPAPLANVTIVTFSTQANTFLLLDAHDKPLTPLIAWTDNRASAESADFEALTSEPDYIARSGVPSLSGQFAAAKVAWLARHDADAFHSAKTLCFLGDYFVLRLTGVHATDASLAALSGLYDVIAGDWCDAWCDRAGVPRDILPPVRIAGEDVGVVRNDVSDQLGLPRGCRVRMGLLDQYAGAIGMGNVVPGGLSETTGTVLATIRCSDRFDTHSTHAIFRGPSGLPGRFFHMSFGDVAGTLLETYRGALPDAPSFETLDALVTPEEPAVALNHRMPIDQLRRAIVTLARTRPRGQAMRCLYQTVANALADQVRDLAGGSIDKIFSGGGAARSRAWLQIKANTLGCSAIAPDCEEPNLIGAAAVASGRAFQTPRGLNIDDARIIHPSLSHADRQKVAR